MPVSPRTRLAAAVVTFSATAVLLSGCDVRETAQDVADQFGNARQVEETGGPVTAADLPPGGAASGSAEPPAAPSALPSFAAETTVGDYAPGFPAALLPIPQGAKLLATSAEPVAGSKPTTLQVTLNLTSKKSPAALMDQVAGTLGGKGFEALDAPADSGMSEQLAFTRTTTVKGAEIDESLLVGILKEGNRSLLTMSGTVAAAQKK